MIQTLCENIYLIILLPLWIFLILMAGRFFSVYVNKYITYILSLISAFFGALMTGYLYSGISPEEIYEYSIPFININNFSVNIGIYADKISIIFAFILFSVSFLILLFSIYYMKNEPKQYRFFALMNLFNFAMSGLFFSPNLFQFYVFWELAGVVSYLLIGFDYTKNENSSASKKVFLINRIGDVSLLGGIIICSYLLFEYASSKSTAMLSFCDLNSISLLIGGYSSDLLFIFISLLFIIAALVKSAQIPFYNWLQDAMEAKLPVSALLHSSTLVALGVYLIIRITPILSVNETIFKFIEYAGLITALICSLCACAERHPKKVLAYSTSAQFGLMFFALGIMDFKTALALFCAHSFIKPVLFITLPDDNKKWSYFNFICFILAGLSLSGLIFAGMTSKEMLVFPLGIYATEILAFISFMTSFYIFRIALVVYDKNGIEKRLPSLVEAIAFIAFFILNISLYFYLKTFAEYRVAEPFWAGLTAFVIVYILYIKKAFKKIPLVYKLCLNGFYLDKFYSEFLSKVYFEFSKFCSKIDEKVFANYCLIINSAAMGVKFISFVEKNIMIKSVSVISKTLNKFSYADSKIQNGNIQRYNFYALVIITIIAAMLVIVYGAIISCFSGGQ